MLRISRAAFTSKEADASQHENASLVITGKESALL
jgi:hypothetical protein